MNQLEVHVDIGGRTVRAGTASFNRRGRSLSTSFTYERPYLADPDAYALDPGLPLFSGRHTVAGIPGSFADCAPDRWGRNLITKRIRAEALSTGTHPKTVDDVDFLVHVADLTRQGSLRFRESDRAPFLSPESFVPKLVELPALLRASDVLDTDRENLASVKALLDAGTGTLGGARPKASVRDGDRLYIAKFPKPSDDWDVMAWEKTALDLAERAGITVPRRRLEMVDGRHVLLLERFDRSGVSRIGYISAMTMMQARDGGSADYIDIAETFTEFASAPSRDLRELWRRIAFSVAIHNTDDHMRNHGLLRESSGWRLSPAFDVNPNPDSAQRRATTIGGAEDSDTEAEALITYKSIFGVSGSDAQAILQDVLDAMSEWKSVAVTNGISASEIERFTGAFAVARASIRRVLTTVSPAGVPKARRRG